MGVACLYACSWNDAIVANSNPTYKPLTPEQASLMRSKPGLVAKLQAILMTLPDLPHESFVSEASLLVDAYHCNALALKERTVIKLPIEALRRQLEQDDRFNANWMQTLNREIQASKLWLAS
jgi:hypothetical protein